MEIQKKQRSSDIFTKNVGVLYNVMGYFGYAHINAFVLSSLCKKSRAMLEQIHLYYKYFFNEMREKITYDLLEFVNLVTHQSFKTQSLKYFDFILKSSYESLSLLKKLKEELISNLTVTHHLTLCYDEIMEEIGFHFHSEMKNIKNLLLRTDNHKLMCDFRMLSGSKEIDKDKFDIIHKISGYSWSFIPKIYCENESTVITNDLKIMLRTYSYKLNNLSVDFKYLIDTCCDVHFILDQRYFEKLIIKDFEIYCSKFDLESTQAFHIFIFQNYKLFNSVDTFKLRYDHTTQRDLITFRDLLNLKCKYEKLEINYENSGHPICNCMKTSEAKIIVKIAENEYKVVEVQDVIMYVDWFTNFQSKGDKVHVISNPIRFSCKISKIINFEDENSLFDDHLSNLTPSSMLIIFSASSSTIVFDGFDLSLYTLPKSLLPSIKISISTHYRACCLSFIQSSFSHLISVISLSPCCTSKYRCFCRLSAQSPSSIYSSSSRLFQIDDMYFSSSPSVLLGYLSVLPTKLEQLDIVVPSIHLDTFFQLISGKSIGKVNLEIEVQRGKEKQVEEKVRKEGRKRFGEEWTVKMKEMGGEVKVVQSRWML